MRTKRIVFAARASSLALAAALCACLMPPSMYERASWPREDGRYRQAGVEGPAGVEQGGGQGGGQPATAPGGAPAQQCPPAASTAPLHAWDGGVVDGAPQGRVTEQAGTPRGLETPPAGRTHIIELYQQVLDERDALAEEVERLRRSLEETSLALDAKTKAADELSMRVAALEASQKELTGENQSMTARLVQAQIRRLEAEKLLLETRIEVERTKAEEAARAAALQTRSGAKTKPAPKAREGSEE